MSIPVLAIPILNRGDFLLRCIRSIDYPIDQLVIINNGSDAGVAAAVRQLQGEGDFNVCAHRPAHNLGVAASWNWVMKNFPAEYWLFVGNDIQFTHGDLRNMDRFIRDHPEYVMCPANWGHSLFALRPSCIEHAGYFDENMWPAYCLAPDTPILTADLQWIPIGDATQGLRLVGVDEDKTFQRSRSYRAAEITAIHRRKLPSLRIVFDDGREVICSSGHRWLGKSPRRTEAQRWITSKDLRAGFRITSPLQTWKTETSYEAGWLSGIYDGEGWLHLGPRKHSIGVSQKPGPVMDRIHEALTDFGFPFKAYARPNEGADAAEIHIRSAILEFLGRIRPMRLLHERFWEGAKVRSKGMDPFATIVAIEAAGKRELVDISTTTKTFIANGLVSHNCEDQDHCYRIKLAGLQWADVPDIHALHGEPPLWGSSTVWSDPVLNKRCAITQKNNAAYYRYKWGGPPGEEKYVRPYNDPNLTIKDWIIDRELAEANENPNFNSHRNGGDS